MTAQQHALALAVETRIMVLREMRSWDRRRPALSRMLNLDAERSRTLELRCLLRLRREARNATREAERLASEAHDRNIEMMRERRIERVLEAAEWPMDREGDPAFSGAWSKW